MYAVICCTQTLPGSSKLKQTGPLVASTALPLQQPISGPDNSLTFLPNAPGWLHHTHHYQPHSQLHQTAGNCLPGTCSSLFQRMRNLEDCSAVRFLSNRRSRTTIKEVNGKSPDISDKDQTMASPGILQAFTDLIEITNIHLTILNSVGFTMTMPNIPSCH